jgi:large subunit ribosomal protein L5
MAKDPKSEKDAKGAKAAPKQAPAQQGKPAKEVRAKKAPKADRPAGKEAAPTQPPRLQIQYQQAIVPALMKQFGYKTKMQVPRVTKITLNMGVGEAVADKKILENAAVDLE